MPVKEPDKALYEVFPPCVLEFNELMSADESKVTVDFVAACAGAIAPTERAAATIAVDAIAATARNARFLFI
jgi:hypothetical protein